MLSATFQVVVAFILIDSVESGPVLAAQPHFSDEFARKKVVPLCAATKLDNPQTCLNRTFENATALRHIIVQCDIYANDTCSGYVAVNRADKAIMMAFRGTVGELQLAVEGEVTNMTVWVAGGTVSKYFYNAFMAVWNGGVKDDFLTSVHKYPDYELWIVGHSLGGSMAALAASYIEKMKLFVGNKIKVVTFGQPRTGNREFADIHGKQIPYTFRVTHKHDVVPHLPWKDMKQYHHHKSEYNTETANCVIFQVSLQKVHSKARKLLQKVDAAEVATPICVNGLKVKPKLFAKAEVFYNNDMTTADYIECDEGESLRCSDGYIDISFNDHHRYYNVYISKWGEAGCVGDPVNPITNSSNRSSRVRDSPKK